MKSLFHKRVGCSYKAGEASPEDERALETERHDPRQHRTGSAELGGGSWRRPLERPGLCHVLEA